MEKKGDNIVSASILASLFGIDFDEKTGKYAPHTAYQQDPTNAEFNALSLIQFFENSPCSDGTTPFGKLVQGTYDTNPQKGTSENSAPAWCQIKLTTVANSLAAISAGRQVELLYVKNAKMLNWQNAFGDSDLKAEIAEGQEPSASGPTSFKKFFYYDLFFKMGLEAKESNGLSRMWGWAIADERNELSRVSKAFYA